MSAIPLTKVEYQLKLPSPFVPGTEAAGVVVVSAPPTPVTRCRVVVELAGGAAFDAGAIATITVNRLLLKNAGVLRVGYGEFIRTNPDAQRDVVAAGSAALVADGVNHIPRSVTRWPTLGQRWTRPKAGGVQGEVVLEPWRGRTV